MQMNEGFVAGQWPEFGGRSAEPGQKIADCYIFTHRFDEFPTEYVEKRLSLPPLPVPLAGGLSAAQASIFFM
jgi:hypothetical protein